MQTRRAAGRGDCIIGAHVVTVRFLELLDDAFAVLLNGDEHLNNIFFCDNGKISPANIFGNNGRSSVYSERRPDQFLVGQLQRFADKISFHEDDVLLNNEILTQAATSGLSL
ncbi:hypothetical protein D3C71_862030 [compost metagenome]